MNYLDRLAVAIQEEVSPDEWTSEDSSDLFRLYALLALVKGTNVTLHDVHDAWSAWMIHQNPKHPFIVPFEQLPADIQDKDLPYMTAIRSVASRL